MGTVFAIDSDGEVDHVVVDEVFDWWREVDHRFSTYRGGSEISRIGDGSLERDDAHPDVRYVLSVCEELEELTEGRFRMRASPTAAVDPSGFVKGWSVDEAALRLRGAGCSDFMLYAGGDVLCTGSPPDAPRWGIGIRDPQNRDQVAAMLSLDEGAVATSGDYEWGPHVWGDAPGAAVASVTVTGPSLGIADALATAIFGSGADDLGWVPRFEGYGVVLIRPDGSIELTGRPVAVS